MGPHWSHPRKTFARVCGQEPRPRCALNPKAQYRNPFHPRAGDGCTHHLRSADPARCVRPIGDGSAAVIVTTPGHRGALGALSRSRLLATMTGRVENPAVSGELVAGVAKRAFDWAGHRPSRGGRAGMPRRHLAGRVDRARRTRAGQTPAGPWTMIRKGRHQQLGAGLPVNTSGGLERQRDTRSQPVVLAQIVEAHRATSRGRLWASVRVDGRTGSPWRRKTRGGYMGPDAAVGHP